MTFAGLIELTRNYKQENLLPHNAPEEIVLFEVLDHIASIKLTAIWGIDYMHLAKYNEKCVIVHVLWQTHSEEVS